ncbi:MAG: helix-turn-helix domain-containing protein [FCB group bacterium]|nr:helix-turn-helix domain-containing protein [FCB group bacterium]
MYTSDLKEVLSAAGMTGADFAQELGVHKSTVSMWMRRKKTTIRAKHLRVFRRVCDEACVPVCPYCGHPTPFKHFDRPMKGTYGMQCGECEKVYTIDDHNRTGVYRW